ncbi:MAG: PP2C family protein-serine/threonine phosphatase [Gammaproteobacteria bacterium]|nr:PP2C family protein-serine/threonine phosphatase [Gammaproteobacteria bacterium]MCY4218346.1 PP2C family protein-serine/threonine phosphatase [Gammaproteobacteria bacterium]
MLLRTRISFIVTLTIGLICSSVVFVGLEREQLIKNQYSLESASDQATLWSKVSIGIINEMEDNESLINENETLIDAVKAQDSAQIQELGRTVLTQLVNTKTVDRLDIVYLDGSIAFSSLPSVFQSAPISPSLVQSFIRDNSIATGIGNDMDRNTYLVYGFPISDTKSNQPVGMAIFSTNILTAITEMEDITGSLVIFVNRRGRLISAVDSRLWRSLYNQIDLDYLNNVQTVNIDDQHFSITVLEQEAELSGLIGRIIFAKDISSLIASQEAISRPSAIIISSLIFLFLVGLYLYMSRAFAPLSESVNVLDALSKGDLQAQTEEINTDNEVGQISGAINVFRDNLLALNRHRRLRERQQARQKRFIIKEMTNLSDTLDGDEREEIIQQLEKIRTIVHDDPEVADQQQKILQNNKKLEDQDTKSGPDSLAMMAIAFQHMSGRVMDAMHTKEELSSIQKELDIATRVQQSLVPENLDISKQFNAAGFMTPAKEVGGDFYDMFRLDEHRIGVAIADVSGKGVPAALFMVMARTLLRSKVFHIKSPATVLEHMNDYLVQNNNEQLFVTLFYGILDEEHGTLTYSTGGHNPPIVSDKNGTRVLEQTEGAVLALIDDIDFKEKCVTLENSSRIVFMTDGVPESFNKNGEAYGDDRTLETIDKLNPEQTPQEDIKQLIDSVESFVEEAPQFDDITCVILHYTKDKQKLIGDHDD